MKFYFKIIKDTYNWLLDTIFPERCIGCQSQENLLCSTCIGKIKKTEKYINDHTFTCFDYQDPLIKKIIWNLKYYNKAKLGYILGELIRRNLYKEISDIKDHELNAPIYVIPVPISPARQKTRGYNQAEKISIGFCNYKEKDIFELRNDIIIKTKNTIPQARIKNKSKRIKNIQGVFKIVNKESIKSKTIIVIDDVTTTGGTIEEVIKILKKSGARKVYGFTVAH